MSIIISPEGLRMDGRRPPELKRISTQFSTVPTADGSCILKHGNTHIQTSIYGPSEPTKRSQSQEHASLDVTIHHSTFSTSESKLLTKRLNEISTFIKQTFEPIIILKSYPKSQILITIQILQLDGGVLQACINSTTLALMDAGIQMLDFVVACCVADVGGKEGIIDLNYMEESCDLAVLTCALLPTTGKISLVHIEDRMHMDILQDRLELARKGCLQLYKIFDEKVLEHLKYHTGV